ncbi:glycosyltransferase family protein [Nocardia aurea]|uniref:hypothetical protein n=1 Tax=Nocardia aurea TaxID=2144174 RepID=UPI0018E55D5E|nr:hypothetical protein [Nocardia aurea]
MIDYVSSLRDGVLVTTRPALSLISARRAPKSVVRVAQDHMNLHAYPEPVREDFARYYGRFDAVAVLTRTNQLAYRELLGRTPVVRIPNPVSLSGEPSRQENPVVVAAGRLVWQKGFDLLVPAFGQAARRHADWELRIFGSGTRRAALAALVGRQGLDGRRPPSTGSWATASCACGSGPRPRARPGRTRRTPSCHCGWTSSPGCSTVSRSPACTSPARPSRTGTISGKRD